MAGIALGAWFPSAAKPMGILGSIFLRLIKSIIAPLLFTTLVSGLASSGSIKTMGRIGGKALLYFEVLTTIALFVGLGFVNLFQPGNGLTISAPASSTGAGTATPSLAQTVEHTFPTSIVDAMAKGEVLQIVVFALIFGAAAATVGSKAKTVIELCDSVSAIMFRFTGFVMWFAPFGVFGAIAATVGERGLKVLANLGKLV